MATMSPFISADDLYAASARGDRMVILDSHWEHGANSPEGFSGYPVDNSSWEAYLSQHIPGSFFCDPQRMLAGTPDPRVGRNPLPDPQRLQFFFDEWGLSADVPVRIYDAGRMLYASRAWWVLRWAGLTDVRILDGGTPAWTAAGGDIAAGIGCMRGHGHVDVRPGALPVLEIGEVDAWVASGRTLVDARGEGRFIGRREPLDRRAGHIPGAVNLPVDVLLDSGSGQGRIPAPEVVAERLATRGVTTGEGVAVYSGSGVDSALFLALMEYAGMPGAAHFVGGWSQWAADRSLPVALGR
jgi:thiosulfate/3-mercaptopyruvate sulfurtransferase